MQIISSRPTPKFRPLISNILTKKTFWPGMDKAQDMQLIWSTFSYNHPWLSFGVIS